MDDNRNIYKKVMSLFLIIIIYRNDIYYEKHILFKPKISVFLPIYNKEIYLINCIESLQKQTLKNIEIVAVNDGSVDQSLKILKKLQKIDKRIKIVNNDRNHGLLYSRAMGILNSTGKYLMNLDPDDKLINDNDLQELYQTAELNNNDILIYLIKRIAVNSFDIEYFKYLDDHQLEIKDDHITNKLIRKDIYLKAFQTFKKEIFDNCWNFHEDNIWSYLVRNYSKSIGILRKYIYQYKRNKDSLNMQRGNEIELINRFYRYNKLLQINFTDNILYSYDQSLKDIKNYYQIFEKKDIKYKIISLLAKFLNYFPKSTSNYKKINFTIKKILDKKIIIIFGSNQIEYQYLFPLYSLIKIEFPEQKNIITLNLSENINISSISNYIYSKDKFIIFGNFIFRKKIKKLLKSFGNNKIYFFTKKKNNLYLVKKGKAVKLCYCRKIQNII